MSITRTLAAALAIGALVAPAAQAQPADTHASTAMAADRAHQKQDLRSADARDAARHPRDAAEAAPRIMPGQPTWPANPKPIASAPAADAADGSGINWTPIAIGIAASLLIVSGLVAVNSRRMRRLHRPRVTA